MTVSLDSLLTNYNVNGEIYLSDVDKWLDHKIDLKKVRQLRDKLMQIKRGDYGKDN